MEMTFRIRSGRVRLEVLIILKEVHAHIVEQKLKGK